MARLPLYKPLPQATHSWVLDLARRVGPSVTIQDQKSAYEIYCLLDPVSPMSRFSMTHYKVLVAHFGTHDMHKVAHAIVEYEFDYRILTEWQSFTPTLAPSGEPPCHCPAWLLLDAWGGHQEGCRYGEWKKSQRLAKRALASMKESYQSNTGGYEL